MSEDQPQARNLRIGIAGCDLFAFVSLALAVHETRTLLHLLNEARWVFVPTLAAALWFSVERTTDDADAQPIDGYNKPSPRLMAPDRV